MINVRDYTVLKDHRTGCETSNVEKVLDGDLKAFTDAYLIKECAR